MKIVYLKRMLQYPTLRTWTNKGMTIEEIQKLESKYNNGNPFPKAYREFLFIAGERTNLGDIDKAFGYDWLQEKAREELQECGKTIDRPFFVINQLDKCEQFGFIYLDENDEDPNYYLAMPAYVDEGFPLVTSSNSMKFSNFINNCLDSAIIEDKYMTKK